MSRLGCVALAMLAAACSDPGAPAPPASSSAPAAAPSIRDAGPATSSSAATNPPPDALGVRSTLARKATPRERFDRDQRACGEGDAPACRRLADRFSGTGLDAGCGVPRERPAPSLKRIPADAPGDALEYARAIGKACTLGDADACALARVATATYTKSPLTVRFGALRRASSGLGIWVFRSRMPPAPPPPGMAARDEKKALEQRRAACLDDVSSCAAPDTILFRQAPAPKDGVLAAAVADLARDVCDETHDCDDIYIALDKARYSPEALAPVRAAFAKTLTAACVEGECTCGDATKYLPAEDPSRRDLAILGCENGEADACALLAELYDQGRGVPREPDRANALYDLSCPPIRPEDDTDDYAPRACDHLAEIYAGGPYPGKDRERGSYYARAACRHPGHEFDHAPCIRLGTLWATKRTVTFSEGMNRTRAEESAYGWEPDFNHECDRPSVAAECAAFKKALETAK